MIEFDPSRYGPAFAPLLVERLPELGPGSPNQAARLQLAALSVESAFGDCQVTNEDAARSCLAALWLCHDCLNESHRLSQEIISLEGNYWHGIMHRREPDYGNAKYWFRCVPQHAIFEPLATAARALAAQAPLDGPAEFLAAQITWDAARFVDLCEAIGRGRSACESLARQIARAEWQLLFDHCYRSAIA